MPKTYNISKSKKQKNIKLYDIVLYTNSDNTISQVRIIGIHYDAPPDIYYTIEFEDKRTKQTILERLSNSFVVK